MSRIQKPTKKKVPATKREPKKKMATMKTPTKKKAPQKRPGAGRRPEHGPEALSQPIFTRVSPTTLAGFDELVERCKSTRADVLRWLVTEASQGRWTPEQFASFTAPAPVATPTPAAPAAETSAPPI